MPRLNEIYCHHRWTWTALQFIFVFDVANGTPINNFIKRTLWTTLRTLSGWPAYEARNDNPVFCTAIRIVRIIPITYVLLATSYSKTSTVGCVSLCVVAMAIDLYTVLGMFCLIFNDQLKVNIP